MITAAEIREYCKCHTVAEAVVKFGVSGWSIQKIKKGGDCRHALQRLLLPHYLSDEQKEFITGNLLGDGSINYQKGQNSFFIIRQKFNNKEYVNGLAAMYYPFTKKVSDSKARKPSRKNGKISHKIDDWDGEYCYASSLRTVSHPIFTDLRTEWYTRVGKTIPRNLKITWRTAATWACDDGCNSGKNCNRFTLSTQSFNLSDVDFLVDRMQKDLNVVAHVNLHTNNKPVINIYGDEAIKFIEGIKPFVPWACFSYKLITHHKTPRIATINESLCKQCGALIKRMGATAGIYCCRECKAKGESAIFDLATACQLYSDGFSVSSIAAKLSISRGTINKALEKVGFEIRKNQRKTMKRGKNDK